MIPAEYFGSVWVAEEAVAKATPVRSGSCEFLYTGPREGDRCTRKAPFWVQRGPISVRSCPGHLSQTVRRFWEIKQGRYGVNEYSDGYWISVVHNVVIKMQVTEGGPWR